MTENSTCVFNNIYKEVNNCLNFGEQESRLHAMFIYSNYSASFVTHWFGGIYHIINTFS